MHHPPNIKKEETPQVLPRSQASQVSATRSLYFILLNIMCLVKQFLQLSIVYVDVIYHIPLFCNGNGFSVSIPTTRKFDTSFFGQFNTNLLFKPFVAYFLSNFMNLCVLFCAGCGIIELTWRFAYVYQYHWQ